MASTIFFRLAYVLNDVVSTFVVSSWGAHLTLGSLHVHVTLSSMYRCLWTFLLLVLWVIGVSLGVDRRLTPFSVFLHGSVSSFSSFVVLSF